jgi:hypothetical protein
MFKRAIIFGLFVSSLPLTIWSQVPGVSTNMVSGTQWPGGDPFLQRQNEPSMAVSSRNPLHVVAGDNDYRTVDLPFVAGADENGDAWLGFFTSYDGGSTWTSTLVPGYPQDTSAQGAASPIHGFQAAADPGVRAGPNGMFLYGGLAFNRNQDGSAVFLARYIDDNNMEGGSTIRYLDTQVIALGNGDAETFLDKPAIAVDMPRGAGTCNIPNADGTSQTIPAFSVYLAWTQFILPESSNNGQIMFSQSKDCGVSWQTVSTPISQKFISTADVIVQPFTNQGAQIAIDPANGNVFVAWRIFANTSTGDTDTISALFFPLGSDGYVHPEIPANVLYQPIRAFDQGTTTASFRTNDYPAVAMDFNHNLYVAWAQREPDAYQDARIDLLTINMNYSACTTCLEGVVLPQNLSNPDSFAPYLVDNYGQYGHQIMPAMAFSAGKLTVAWYDFRDDEEELLYTSTNNPADEYTFTLQPDGSFTFGSQFAPQVSDPSGAG